MPLWRARLRQYALVRRRDRRLVQGLAIVAAVLAGLWLAYLLLAPGRTPPSGFLSETFGSTAVLFDRSYQGGGSSEDRTRAVVMRTARSPEEVISTLARKRGWRRVGEGVVRDSDGVCVVAYSPADYLSTHDEERVDVGRVVTRHGQSVVLSLLYC